MNRIAAVMATVSLLPLSAGAQRTSAAVIEELAAANRVLAAQGILPGYGHVGVRSPENPNRYFLSRSIAPELLTADGIVGFDLHSAAIDSRGFGVYPERFIHGEIHKARPDVQVVVGRSITLEENTQMQSEVLARGEEITYLALEEEPEGFDIGRSWDSWKRQLPARP